MISQRGLLQICGENGFKTAPIVPVQKRGRTSAPADPILRAEIPFPGPLVCTQQTPLGEHNVRLAGAPWSAAGTVPVLICLRRGAGFLPLPQAPLRGFRLAPASSRSLRAHLEPSLRRAAIVRVSARRQRRVSRAGTIAARSRDCDSAHPVA